jgi:hypothetical protein
MNIMKTASFDLFPTHVKIFDFEEDAELENELLRVARSDAALNSSVSGKSLLLFDTWWAERLRSRLDQGLRAYLADVFPGRTAPFDVEAYAFFNHTTRSSFTVMHDHLLEADLVGVYYVATPDYVEERHDTSYYALDEGLLVLHDPRPDARVDRRSPSTRDHFRIYPRRNRLVIHPAHVKHSVTPNQGQERLAVACGFGIDRKALFEGYVSYELKGC